MINDNKKITGLDNKIIFVFPDGKEKECLLSNEDEIYKLLNESNISILGNNNKIVLSVESENDISKVLLNKGLNIAIVGNNNLVKLGKVTCPFYPPLGIKGLNVLIGGSADVWTDPNTIRYANDCKVSLGDNILVNGVVMYLQESSSSINVGNNCMFSWGIDVWCTDVHTITDLSGNPMNFGRSIEIGNHVWIGKDVKIGKNTKISDDSIIGWNSLVTKKFQEPNVVIAGNPAKIIKTGVNWNSRCPDCYLDYINDTNTNF